MVTDQQIQAKKRMHRHRDDVGVRAVVQQQTCIVAIVVVVTTYVGQVRTETFH